MVKSLCKLAVILMAYSSVHCAMFCIKLEDFSFREIQPFDLLYKMV